MLVVDWWQRVCEISLLYWYSVLYIRFVECCLICIWLVLNNLFERMLMHLFLLAISLFVHKVEKEDHCTKEKPENYKHFSNCFKRHGVIHKWDSFSDFFIIFFKCFLKIKHKVNLFFFILYDFLYFLSTRIHALIAVQFVKVLKFHREQRGTINCNAASSLGGLKVFPSKNICWDPSLERY